MPASSDESLVDNDSKPVRKCECKCRADCKCACPCPHQCICIAQCQGGCDKLPVKDKKSRNLVVSIDGTSNQFGRNNTNVVELHSRIIKDNHSTPQLTFYLSGIGTYVPPSFRSFAYWKQLIANKIDLAIAWNFKRHVQDAYRWLADHYQPGDIIFLFGFSRGAYQVRALSGMIATMGLVYTGNQRLIPFAYELYSNRLKGKEIARKDAGELCIHFKKTFSRDVRVHFLGAWDTVSSVGIFRGQPLPLTTSADHICHFRHALAIDERRVRFQPEYVHSAYSEASENRDDKQATGQLETSLRKGADLRPDHSKPTGTMKEVWFAGTHSDIGGGNTENITLDLAGVPLLWMENEARSAGIHLLPRTGVWNWELLKKDKPKESLKGPFWWFLERIPLSRSKYTDHNLDETIRWPPHNGKGRVIVKDQLVHASVAFKDENYKPRASFSSSKLTWNSLVGRGNLQDIGWAQEWQPHLEMDLFDPALAGEIGRDFVEATGEHRWQHLTRVPFLALSENGISSLVDTGVVAKLISILEETGVDFEMQVISSTCLDLMMKSQRSNTEEQPNTSNNARQQLIHLTLLAKLDAPIHSDIWGTVSEVIMGLVENSEVNEVDLYEFDTIIKGFIPRVMELLKDGDEAVRSATALTITVLVGNAGLHDAIKPFLLEIIKSCDDSNRWVRMRTATSIGTLVDYSKTFDTLPFPGSASFPASFHDSIKPAVPKIVQLLKDDRWVVQEAAASTVGKLSEHAIFHDSIKHFVPEILELLRNNNGYAQSQAGITLAKLAEDPVFHDSIAHFVSPLGNWLKDDHRRTRLDGVNAIGELVEHAVFHDFIRNTMKPIVELLADRDGEVRLATVNTIGKFAEQAALHDMIKPYIHRVAELLKDEDYKLREAAATSIGKFSEHRVFHDSIRLLVPQLIQSLKDDDEDVRAAGVTTMGKLIEHTVLDDLDLIRNIVNLIVESLADHDWEVRLASVNTIGKLAEQAALHDTIKPYIPRVAELLKDEYYALRKAAATSIGKFAEHRIFHDSIRSLVPQLIELLKDGDEDVRSDAVTTMGKLIEHTVLDDSELIKNTVNLIGELLVDADWRVRLASVDTIGKFAEQTLRNGLAEWLVPLSGV
ncbi:hypothetical protein C8R44DRAFT_846729 [Mycena epipterygia]|nr:hypothetical protein C8R44DRAFT_846729 [Mycena epipterygia]